MDAAPEEELRRSNEQLLAERTRELATLLSVQQAITSRLDRQEVLQMIADGACQLIDCDGAIVYLVDGEMLRLAVMSPRPDPAHPLGVSIGYTMPIKQSLAGLALQTGKPVLVPNVRNDPRSNPDVLQRTATRSALAVPLIARDQPLGVMLAANIQDQALTSEDERILSLLASSAVIGLENARLYKQAEETAALAERTRLARELHDAVTQTLFSASLIADVLPQIWEKDPEEGRHRLEELRQSTRGALAEMRTLLLELRPSALLEAETGNLLKHLGEAFTGRTRVPLQIQYEGTCPLPAEIKIGLYRIAQEALNNIAHHADAKRVTLKLICHPEHVVLEIRDDGVGFDPCAVPVEHLGLRIMQERAANIGAEFTIQSSPGMGTTVRVHCIPKEGRRDPKGLGDL